MRVLFRDRNLALFMGSTTVSLLGDWALLLALPFFVYGRTHSILSTGGLVVAELLPRLIVSPIAGVLADRWNRKLSLIGADVFRAVLLLSLLVTAAGGPIWIVYAVAVLESSAGQLFTAAQGALLPSIVRRDELLTANSLVSMSTSAVRLIGPPIGGVLYAALGLKSSVVADSASFALSALVLLAIRVRVTATDTETVTKEQTPAFLTDLLDGVRCVVRDRVFQALCLVLGGVMIGQGMLETLLVPFVRDVLRLDALGYGVLTAAQGAGALLGALAVGAVARLLTSGRIVGISLVVAGAALVMFILVRPLPAGAASLFLLSVPVVVAAVWIQTYYQQRVSTRMLGRVLGLTETVSATGIVVGVAVASVAGDRFGVVALMLAAAGVLVVVGLAAIGALWRATTEAPASAPESTEVPLGAD